jgi:hypothetical protein
MDEESREAQLENDENLDAFLCFSLKKLIKPIALLAGSPHIQFWTQTQSGILQEKGENATHLGKATNHGYISAPLPTESRGSGSRNNRARRCISMDTTGA